MMNVNSKRNNAEDKGVEIDCKTRVTRHDECRQQVR